MSSSDDDVPLGQRNQAFLLGKTRPVVLDSSDDDSPLPSWLKNHKSPVEPGGALDTDSDSGIREIISPVKLLTPTKQKSEQEQQREPPAGEIPAPKPASGPKKKPSSAKKAGAGAAVDKSGQGTSSQQPDASQRTGPEPAQPSGRPALPGVGIPAPSSCLPVVLPDKLSQVKLLMELESTDEVHGATDLSGDSGAIGRVMLTGAPGAQQVQVDLKGAHRMRRGCICSHIIQHLVVSRKYMFSIFILVLYCRCVVQRHHCAHPGHHGGGQHRTNRGQSRVPVQ